MFFGAFLIPGFLAYCLPLFASNRSWLTGIAVLGFVYLGYRWVEVSRHAPELAMPGLVRAGLLVQAQGLGLGGLVRAIQLSTGRRSQLGSGLVFTVAGALVNLVLVLVLMRPAP